MKKVAVILSGCGYLDGSEIHESVLTLLELNKNQAQVQIFAPNINQLEVINHLTNLKINQQRNVLIESARIARGKIKSLNELKVNDFDALIMPGGFGAAKNLSSIAHEQEYAKIHPEISETLLGFISARKPIGCICISPYILAILLKDKKPKLTLGNESNLLEKIGLENIKCNTNEIVVDETNLIVCSPAYMHQDSLSNIHAGISKLVTKILELS